MLARLEVDPERELRDRPSFDRIGDISVGLPDGSTVAVDESECWKEPVARTVRKRPRGGARGRCPASWRMAILDQIVIDCHHPSALARFWAACLDGFEVRAYDSAEIERLAALGLTPGTDPAVIVDGPHIEICFQKVDPPPVAKTPVHLDLRTDDRAAEAQRLVALGASIKHRYETHTWLQDPEGNDFCPGPVLQVMAHASPAIFAAGCVLVLDVATAMPSSCVRASDESDSEIRTPDSQDRP